MILIAAALVFVGLVAFCIFGKSGGKKGPKLFGPDPTADPNAELPGQDIIRIGWKKGLIEDPDVIVIGSGIGGLTTAGFLARAGKKVLVVEAHDRAGGCTHTFEEHGWEWDVGIHYIGRVHEDAAPNKVILDAVSDGKIKWEKMHEAFDTVVVGDKQYPIYAGRDKQIAGLVKEFPKEEKAIRQYFKDLSTAKNSSAEYFLAKIAYSTGGIKGALMRLGLKLKGLVSAPAYKKWVDVSAEDHIRTLTDNDELVGVLLYCYGDYGTPPKHAPFFMHAILVDHYIHGGYYPVGGPSVIARAIVPVIQRHGGNVVVRCRVKQIICENGRAVGIKIENGPEVRAPMIISGAGFHNTFNTLLPKEVAEATGLKPEINSLGHSATHLSLFIGLEGSNEDLKLESRNYWCFPTYDHEKNEAECKRDPFNNLNLFFISFPSAKDPAWQKARPGLSTAVVLSTADYEIFEEWKNAKIKKRGAAYESLKQDLEEQMLARLYRLAPHLKGKVKYTELGTPLSTQHYIEAARGESYGLDHMPERFKTNSLAVNSKVPGLYMTGQDMVTAGFISAMFAGLLTASSILDRNLYFEMLSERSRMRKREAAAKKSS